MRPVYERAEFTVEPSRKAPLTSLSADVYADGMTEWHAALDKHMKGQTT